MNGEWESMGALIPLVVNGDFVYLCLFASLVLTRLVAFPPPAKPSQNFLHGSWTKDNF